MIIVKNVSPVYLIKKYGVLFDIKLNNDYICIPIIDWSSGRVARQSSAKARTAVRIRSRPQQKEHPYPDALFLFPQFYSIFFPDSCWINFSNLC